MKKPDFFMVLITFLILLNMAVNIFSAKLRDAEISRLQLQLLESRMAPLIVPEELPVEMGEEIEYCDVLELVKGVGE